MSILLMKMVAGPKFTIYAMAEADDQMTRSESQTTENCPVRTFFKECNEKDTAQLVRRLQYTAQNGPSWNKEQCRQLTTDIWEFKTGGGLRLLWFYDKGQLIICTSGYVKKRQKADPKEIKRAEDWKKKYDFAKQKNEVSIAQEDIQL